MDGRLGVTSELLKNLNYTCHEPNSDWVGGNDWWWAMLFPDWICSWSTQLFWWGVPFSNSTRSSSSVYSFFSPWEGGKSNNFRTNSLLHSAALSIREGKSCLPKVKGLLSQEDEEKMWQAGVLESDTVTKLVDTLLILFRLRIALRAKAENRQLHLWKQPDFSVSKTRIADAFLGLCWGHPRTIQEAWSTERSSQMQSSILPEVKGDRYV